MPERGGEEAERLLPLVTATLDLGLQGRDPLTWGGDFPPFSSSQNFLYACGHDILQLYLRVIRCNTYSSIIVSAHHPENVQIITYERKSFV